MHTEDVILFWVLGVILIALVVGLVINFIESDKFHKGWREYKLKQAELDVSIRGCLWKIDDIELRSKSCSSVDELVKLRKELYAIQGRFRRLIIESTKLANDWMANNY